MAIRGEAVGWCASAEESASAHPQLPPPLDRTERWEVPCTAGGWVGVGDAGLKSHLVLGEKGPICLLSPGPASPTPNRGHRTRDAHWAASPASPGCSELGSALSGAEVGIGEAPGWLGTGPGLAGGASWVSGGSEDSKRGWLLG